MSYLSEYFIFEQRTCEKVFIGQRVKIITETNDEHAGELINITNKGLYIKPQFKEYIYFRFNQIQKIKLMEASDETSSTYKSSKTLY